MCVYSGLGYQKYGAIEEVFGCGVSKDQIRRWQENEVKRHWTIILVGKEGARISVKQGVQSMFVETTQDQWEELKKLHPDKKLPFVFQMDGGSIDTRNRCIFVKLGRQDQLWEKGNYYKKPQLHTTLAILSMKEKYTALKEPLEKIVKEMEEAVVEGGGWTWKVAISETHDYIMNLCIQGHSELWHHTSSIACSFCGIRRRDPKQEQNEYSPEWVDMSRHRFVGSITTETWEELRKLDEDEPGGEPELSISKPENHVGLGGRGYWSLEQKIKDGKEVEELKKEMDTKKRGAKTKYEEAVKRTGMIGPPLTNTETKDQRGELIHINENVTQKCIGLIIEDTKYSSEQEKHLFESINYHAKTDISRKKSMKDVSTKDIIKKKRLGSSG